jgi:hypothetical protein
LMSELGPHDAERSPHIAGTNDPDVHGRPYLAQIDCQVGTILLHSYQYDSIRREVDLRVAARTKHLAGATTFAI